MTMGHDVEFKVTGATLVELEAQADKWLASLGVLPPGQFWSTSLEIEPEVVRRDGAPPPVWRANVRAVLRSGVG